MATNWTKPDTQTLTPYKKSYIDRVPEGDLSSIMEKNMQETALFLQSIPSGKLNFRYASGKWSIPQIVMHMSDTERIFSYRILCIARGDKTPLPGYEENDYARESGADARDFAGIIREFITARNSTLSLLKSLSNHSLDNTGTSNNMAVSVRELAYMLAGHELHHINVIKERYLK